MDSNAVSELAGLLTVLTSKDISSTNKNSLWSLLYFVVAKNGQHLKELFPDTKSELPKTQAEAMLPGRDFFKFKKENVTHVGRNCGRKFKRGEPIYRCLDCSFDNTCVLCVHCFNKDDHVGHQVSASICNGSNTGICDCGDPEAWKKELHCKCNSKILQDKNPDAEIFDESYETYLQSVFNVLLDFVIEIFSHQNQTLPSVNRKLKSQLSTQGKKEEAVKLLQEDIDDKVLKSAKYNDHEKVEQIYVVLWNDEFHNFHEAQSAITSATNDSRAAAKKVATDVDREGRTVLLKGPKLDDLITGFINVQSNGLTATVMSKNDFLRQDYTKTIIDWCLDTINLPNIAFQTIARRALCKSLCSTFESENLVSHCWSSLYSQVSGLLNAQNLPYVVHETIDPTKEIKSSETIVSDISNEVNVLAEHTRLQYLLYFDIRYWKTLRKKVHDLLIPPLVSDLEYKVVAGNQIVEIYGLLINGLSKLDREPHLNALDEIACQFFTCPTNSTNVIGSKKIQDVLYPVIHLFEGFSASSYTSERKFKIPHRTIDKSTSYRKSFSRTINDLTYLFEKTNTLKHFYEPQNFIAFCYLTKLFDCNWCIERKVGEHVENENYDFVDYFSYTLQLLGVIYAASDSNKIDGIDNELLISDIQRLIQILSLNEVNSKIYKSHQLVDFKVSSAPTGFLNPSNVLLSRLIQSVASSSDELKKIVDGYDFLKVVDSSLRAIVLCVQIESQFWVRNGLNALKQANTYKSSQLLHDSVYYRDIHLSQITLMTSDPERAFLNIIDRFELLDWFSNKVQLTTTIYEDKVFTMIGKLIDFLYVLLSERSLFIEFETNEKSIRHRLKQVLIYSLYVKPLTYSEIEESLYEELTEFESLDEVLNDVTEFTPPRGLNDDGRYCLRPEYYKAVDPLKILAQLKDFQDNVTIISKALAKGSNTSPDDIIIEPKLAKIEEFKNLGDFTRTSEFAKFVYKLLEYSIQNDQESFVPQLLHLLHAVFKDSEMYNGKSHIIDAFVQIPVCESLFAIATSTSFTKQTTKKADHLLESLIVKDSRTFFDSLLSSFGQDAVNDYKEKKKSNGVNFDETEPERKRRMAKERQRKIMEKMSKKQKLFIEKNDNDSQEFESENSVSPEDARTCVLCQSGETKDEVFGSPVSFIKSNIFRNLPLENKYWLQRAFMDWSDDSIGNNQDAVGIDFPLSDQLTRNFSSNLVATSCNHCMHFKCLKNYMSEHSHSTPSFACPLCKTFHNQFLPIAPQKNVINLKFEKGRYPTINEIAKENFEDFSADYEREYKESKDLVLGKDFSIRVPELQHAKKIIKILSYSIDQAEIATRINGSSSYTGFLKQIPEQSYMVLRALFQNLILAHKDQDLEYDDFKDDDLRKMGFTHRLISHFIISEKDVLFAGPLIKMFFKQYIVSSLNRTQKFGEVPLKRQFELLKKDDIDIVRKIIKDEDVAAIGAKSRFMENDSFGSQIIGMALALIRPALRSTCILLRVLSPEFEMTDDCEIADHMDILSQSVFQKSFFQLITAANLDKHLQKHIQQHGKLPYPGVIKLVDLPLELNYFTTGNANSEQSKRFRDEAVVQNSNNRIDFCICLTCGRKVFKNEAHTEKLQHIQRSDCDSGPDALFLTPNADVVHLISDTVAGHYSKVVNAPYLNTHGQSGVRAVQNGQLAKLNIERYKYLNNLWLSGSVFSYLSRNSTPVIPRVGFGDWTEQRFWDQLLATPRPDAGEDGAGDNSPIVLGFPPPGDYVDELRVGPFDDGEDSESDDEEGSEEFLDPRDTQELIIDSDDIEEEFDDEDDFDMDDDYQDDEDAGEFFPRQDRFDDEDVQYLSDEEGIFMDAEESDHSSSGEEQDDERR